MRTWICAELSLLCLVLLLPTPLIAETLGDQPPETVTAPSDSSGSNETLRAFLQLQEQIHTTKLAIENSLKEADAATARGVEEVAARSAELMTGHLQAMEQKLSAQRADDAQFTLYLLSSFAAFSFLAVVVTTYFQWRTVSRLADFTASLPGTRVASASATGAVGFDDNALLGSGSGDLPGHRLLDAVERLEKRILELEQSATPVLGNAVSVPRDGDSVSGEKPAITARPAASTVDLEGEDGVRQLLQDGQALLNAENPEAALAAFDGVLAVDPDNAEALVKKGTALEKLRKLPEAIECYDRAIAADASMTIAYLHKGGLYNRMERFGEAVECYEKALRTQERQSAA